MYLAYTYLITNKITNEYYYGSRFRNIALKRMPDEDFWIYYFTSSKYVANLINTHGKDSFDIQIIMADRDYNKCYLYEQELINEHLGKALCLNKSCHTTGKFSTAGLPLSDIHKAKISAANKDISRDPHTTEHREKIAIANKGKHTIPCSDETKAKISLTNTGHLVSDETKAKIGNKHKGKIITEEQKEKIRQTKKNNPKPGPNKGKIMSDEQKAKISATKKGIPASDETNARMNAAGKTRNLPKP